MLLMIIIIIIWRIISTFFKTEMVSPPTTGRGARAPPGVRESLGAAGGSYSP